MRAYREIGALAAAESVGRGAAWLTLFALPWLLSANEYGIVVLIATFEGVATGFLLLGQDRAVLWRYARSEDLVSDRTAVGVAMLVTTVACVIAFALGSIPALLTGGTLLGVPVWPHLLVLALAVIFGNINLVALAFARIARRTRDFVVTRTAVGGWRLTVTLSIGAIWGSSLSYPVGLAVGTALGGARLWRCVWPRRWAPAAGTEDVRVMIRYGAPVSAHLLALAGIQFVDRWVIGAMLGLSIVGSYSWYYMLGSAVAFLYAALSVYYEPEIYREHQREVRDRTAVREYLGATFVAAGLYGLIGSVAVVFGSALVPSSVQADPAIIRIVLIAHWLHPIYLVCNYLLSSIGRTVSIAGISAFAVVCTLLANLVFVPILGAIGGAWATLVGAICLVTTAMVVVRYVGIVASLRQPFFVVFGLGGMALLIPRTWMLASASCALTVYGASLLGLFQNDRLAS